MRGVEPTRIPSGPRARRGTQAASALGAVSHAIRLNELSTVSTNVAIPTIWLRGAARCRGELHATFAESSPGGTHVLPLIAPPVAQPVTQPVAAPVAQPLMPPVAQPVAAPVAQPATCQRPGTVKTISTNNLPKPHPDRSRSHAQTRNETTTSNTNFPTPTSRKVTTQPTRFAHPPRWHQPTKTPTFPHQHAEKTPHNQHALPVNPYTEADQPAEHHKHTSGPR